MDAKVDLGLVAACTGNGVPIGREPSCAAGVEDFELRSGLVGQLGLQQRRHAHYQLHRIVSRDCLSDSMRWLAV